MVGGILTASRIEAPGKFAVLGPLDWLTPFSVCAESVWSVGYWRCWAACGLVMKDFGRGLNRTARHYGKARSLLALVAFIVLISIWTPLDVRRWRLQGPAG